MGGRPSDSSDTATLKASDTTTSISSTARAIETTPARGRVRRAVRAVVSSRTTWFAAGTLAGVVGALALTAYVATTQVRGSTTLVVAADGTAPFASIAAAVAASRPGDVIRVDPGEYREEIVLTSGADLVARVPGTVSIVPDSGAAAGVWGALFRASGELARGEPPRPVTSTTRVIDGFCTWREGCPARRDEGAGTQGGSMDGKRPIRSLVPC